METLLYYPILGLVRGLQALPLTLVAWLGRRLGLLAYFLDRRHRRVALDNLTQALGDELGPAGVRRVAREHFRRLGENYASAVKTASMSLPALRRHVRFLGIESLRPTSPDQVPVSRVFALGHFGNFELFAWAGHVVPPYEAVTTYHALPQPKLNALLLSLRQKSGCMLFDRHTQSAHFLRHISRGGQLVGLLSDQNAHRLGIPIPFFGRDCSTLTAPAVLAQRCKLPLHTAFCFRLGLARWSVEVGDEIPTFVNGRRRPVAEVMCEVNQAFELAVRRDPANWFWVHRRWKAIAPEVGPMPRARGRAPAPAPAPDPQPLP